MTSINSFGVWVFPSLVNLDKSGLGECGICMVLKESLKGRSVCLREIKRCKHYGTVEVILQWDACDNKQH